MTLPTKSRILNLQIPWSKCLSSRYESKETQNKGLPLDEKEVSFFWYFWFPTNIASHCTKYFITSLLPFTFDNETVKSKIIMKRDSKQKPDIREGLWDIFNSDTGNLTMIRNLAMGGWAPHPLFKVPSKEKHLAGRQSRHLTGEREHFGSLLFFCKHGENQSFLGERVENYVFAGGVLIFPDWKNRTRNSKSRQRLQNTTQLVTE